MNKNWGNVIGNVGVIDEELDALVDPIKQKLKLWKVGDKVKWLRRYTVCIGNSGEYPEFTYGIGEITKIAGYSFFTKELGFVVDRLYHVDEKEVVKIGG